MWSSAFALWLRRDKSCFGLECFLSQEAFQSASGGGLNEYHLTSVYAKPAADFDVMPRQSCLTTVTFGKRRTVPH
jgi:hypothetical protein